MESALFRLENLVLACKLEWQPSYSTSDEISAHSEHFGQYLPKLKIWPECKSVKLKKIKNKIKRKRKRKRWSKGYVRGETKSKKMRIRAIWFIYMWIEEVKIYWKTKWCSGILREEKNMMKIRKLDREHRQWDEKEKINEEFRCGWEDEGINLTWLVTLLEILWVELPKCFFYFFFNF